ncbi:hypothetical protein N7470_010106 [Penicillium chermesinum]|nr:hypothetical protein N7470_010106 [Penicillium chermesinum]
MGDKCFYHPAPMTKRRGSDHANPPPIPVSRLASQPNSTMQSIKSGVSPQRAHSQPRWKPPSAPSGAAGYLGSVSFTAVLTEHRNEIPFEPEESSDSFPVLSVEPDRIQSGADVLLFLYNLNQRKKVIEKYYSHACNAAVPWKVIVTIMDSIQEIFDGLNPADLMNQLQELATLIFRNSSRALSTHQGMTADEYCASFTGSNFRWEALGNMLPMFGQQIMVTPANDTELLGSPEDSQAKEQILEHVARASTICLSFCDQSSSANELLALMQYNHVMFLTQHYGDSSYLAWRRLGDLVATIYAAGLHLDPAGSESYPFFLRQWRRGCFICAFYMDKMMATFVGRPPLMNHRYCTLDPPLDLSDEILIQGGEPLARAVAASLAIAREKTLDIALATPETQNLLQRASEIQDDLQRVWEAAPAYLRHDREDKKDSREVWISIVYLYLNYLYTGFLLQRAIIKHINTGHDRLYDISRRLLTIVTSITTQRNSMVDLDTHYSWIALTYGLPSASVLLIELLHQSHAPTPNAVPLPRAEIIRNLSVFVSLLSWISRPGQGNYRECKEAEKKLSRILDQLLDPQPVQADLVNDVTSNLSSFLNWSNYNSWDFNPEYFPAAEGFPGML